MRRGMGLLLLITAAALLLGLTGAAVHGAVQDARRPGDAYQASLRPPVLPEAPFPQGEINVNTADLAALDTLPGVGPAIGQAILDERAQNGPFRFPEDLIAVKGIGEKTLQKLWEHIRLGEP